MALIFAKPAKGIALPLPDGRPWPAEGEWVDDADRYVRRRLMDEDIVQAEPPAETAGGDEPADAAPPTVEAPAGEPAAAPAEAPVTPKTSGKRSA